MRKYPAVFILILVAPAAYAAPGDQWILPIEWREGGGWIQHPGAGYNGSSAWQGQGKDLIRRIYWRMRQPGVPTGAALYRIDFFYPTSGPGDWQPIESWFRGVYSETFPIEPLIPWAGSYGTNHQWIGAEFLNGTPGTWKETGPGPHTPHNRTYEASDAGVYMWLTSSSYLYAKWDFQWETDHTWAELRVTQVTESCEQIIGQVSGGGSSCDPTLTMISVNVVGLGVPPYTITLSNGGGTLTGASPLQFFVTPSATTTYTMHGYDANGCFVSNSGSATVRINAPTPAAAGSDRAICAGGTIRLAANVPSVGTGQWSVVSGGAGTFAPNASTPGATFTHTGGAGPITLRWTTLNPPCNSSSDDMLLTLPAVAADFNGDCPVDADDFNMFAACATGAGVPYDPQTPAPGCALAADGDGVIAADFDRDGDVDIDDFGVFQRCYSGPGNPPDPHCAD